MVKRTRGMRMVKARGRAKSAPKGKGRISRRPAGKRVLRH